MLDPFWKQDPRMKLWGPPKAPPGAKPNPDYGPPVYGVNDPSPGMMAGSPVLNRKEAIEVPCKRKKGSKRR